MSMQLSRPRVQDQGVSHVMHSINVEHHRHLNSNKLHSLLSEACVCKQWFQGGTPSLSGRHPTRAYPPPRKSPEVTLLQSVGTLLKRKYENRH